VADAAGGDHLDAGRQQGLHVLPPVGVSRARRVAVGQLIDQSNLGPAGQHRGQIQLRSHRAQVGECGAGMISRPASSAWVCGLPCVRAWATTTSAPSLARWWPSRSSAQVVPAPGA
jgi:hypothetical protein